jgi:tRNA pseudouridine38-40 synthase
MIVASQAFMGTHDFRGFMAKGSSIKDTIRTIEEVKITQDGEFLKLAFRGNGFLYNMVRIISGTLLFVGVGKIDSKDISNIIESKNRLRAGMTLPAHGLYLEKVLY